MLTLSNKKVLRMGVLQHQDSNVHVGIRILRRFMLKNTQKRSKIVKSNLKADLGLLGREFQTYVKTIHAPNRLRVSSKND